MGTRRARSIAFGECQYDVRRGKGYTVFMASKGRDLLIPAKEVKFRFAHSYQISLSPSLFLAFIYIIP